ncbi:hypothetical protein GGC03_25430 (plasmid) [Vibrio sp. THAF191c]|nr:hypothetical protein FIU99_25275 [Vibrio sp. THAF64]QGM37792.1 hypothetical protein GGC04_26205 [Vibrio sp. THAF191d]QGN73135.1 hypothetical protein GGC03_25430 [Vibrio sp. THAF191c]
MTTNPLYLACLVTACLSGCAAGLGDDYTCDAVGGFPGCGSMLSIRQAMVDDTALTIESLGPLAESAPATSVSPRYHAPQPRQLTIFPHSTPQGHFVSGVDLFFTLSSGDWQMGSPQVWWTSTDE